MDILNDYENADTLSIDTLTLEKLLQDERKVEITQLHALSKKVQYLHADVLYYRNASSELGTSCYEAWKTIVKKVGGTSRCWRDLGHLLGVTPDDLNYIMNAVTIDPVDMVLKVFRQNEKATLDKVIDAFIKLKRYDILKAVEGPLCKIVQFFNKEDSGYQSNQIINGQKEIVTLKNLVNDLPPALNRNIVSKDNDPRKPKQTLQLSYNKAKPKESNSPILFLTFTQDGLPTAINIQEYVDNWTEVIGVKIITLNGKRDEIYQNPEKFIREYFEKASFIVPIITSGYLNEIKSYNGNIPNTSENLDHKYVNFIYNLIVNNYIHASGCLNKKVRSVLPQNVNVDVIQSIVLYPDLLPWTYETNFDEQFQAFLKEFTMSKSQD